MKKVLLISFCILFIFTSCKKKSEVVPVNTITATVNGVNMNFNVNIHAQYDGDFEGTGNTGLTIVGGATIDSITGLMGISIVTANANSITKGTYIAANANNTPPIWAALSYTDFNSVTNSPGTNYVSNINNSAPFTITITSISNTNVQGTFSGILGNLNNSSDIKTVNNGKFNVKIGN